MLKEFLRAFATRHGLDNAAMEELETLTEEAARQAASTSRSSTTVVVSDDDEITAEGTLTADITLDSPLNDAPARPSGAVQVSPAHTLTLAVKGQRSYQHERLLGRGGMAEVHRVHDPRLHRSIAMKVTRGDQTASITKQDSLLKEAQVTSQLQHPNIIPVYELGSFDDGRLYFTMREVRGETLSDAIAELHSASSGGVWETSPSGWTLRRLVDALRRVCEAMAYAHDRGVLHRDLKPSNIMLGAYGEVLVVDWGIARIISEEAHCPQDPINPVLRDAWLEGPSPSDPPHAIEGTPAYMPAEQILSPGDLSPRGDVYALGAILFKILVGVQPYEGTHVMDILRKVVMGPGPSLEATRQRQGAPPPPDDLVDICHRAMARDPSQRYPHAGELAEAIAAWQDGLRQREKAQEMIEVADQTWDAFLKLKQDARSLKDRAESMLSGLRANDPVDLKREGWALQDQAEALETDARLKEVAYLQELRVCLEYAPDLTQAHQRLARYHLERHRDAERRRNHQDAAEHEILLRAHDRGQHSDYLRGAGRLTLLTDPPGATVEILRFELKERRLQPRRFAAPLTSPIVEHELPIGSYLLRIAGRGRAPILYPVHIERAGHWDGIPPGEHAPLAIRLPLPTELGDDEVYVPAGWYRCGGDEGAFNALPEQRLWVDAFIIKRFPVTNAEYICFLEDCAARGAMDVVQQAMPRERSADPSSLGVPIYAQTADGQFTLRPDSAGDLWLPRWPVTMIDWRGALAYATWLSQKENRPWRLPGELEWEKAARGADGRFFPWGDFIDPTWALVRESMPDRTVTAEVDTHPIDTSPYGVRGMGGNVVDLCADPYIAEPSPLAQARVKPPDTSQRSPEQVTCVVRGGSWGARARSARCARRDSWTLINRDYDMGFRLVRSYPS